MEIVKWFIMGFAWGTGVGFLITFISIRIGLKKQEEERKLFAELDRKVYLHACGYDEKECQETHLPGDCPLCGAV